MWERADVRLEGDPALQQAVRFALFHVVQAAARAEGRAIPAKGLTGAGYDGHTFWDMEAFTLPVLTYVAPDAARDALRWRHATIDLAEERARELGLDGVTFPWRTIRGQECSGYWPASTAAFHINADVADAARRYVAASGDEEFDRGLESRCWSRPPGCGARWATTIRAAASASTVSPVLTSTRRSSTTTSTRT
jgi:alpha,alpha-trehalose phosphorylase